MVLSEQIVVNSFDQFLELVNPYYYKRYVFRGIGNHEFQQTPSLLFEEEKKKIPLTKKEEQSIRRILTWSNKFNVDKLSTLQLARHYGFPCRLVDYSLNPFVSLYFACKEEDKDGKVICFDYFSYTNKYFPEDEAISLTNKEVIDILFKRLTDGIKGGKITKNNGKIKDYTFDKPRFVFPLIHDNRINRQNGIFLLWPDTIKEENLNFINPFCIELIIKKESKKELLEGLNKYGYNHETIEKVTSTFVGKEEKEFADFIEKTNSINLETSN